ncbi:Stress responsive A/B Barrel Domain [Oligella ureolytica]|uniref:Dabb family protein n=2 Tax=Oligella ureolytica TaxID=90244 RepID=A0A378XEL2_9BURK|nr:Dabb family protein [Oligella ureolytica]QPT41230.1 Dabb family protein [Oligella ureolytica]SUA54186.1 Stress responsive A/B Barrel Domain [Oligella ureolytica]SUA55069.1 Stress responsive A/B Barrel Domain [Oligella ureolytica]
MIIHMVLFKFEEPVTADFEETVEYHCEQIRQHCEGVILFDLKKNFSDRAGGFVYALSSIFKDVESLEKYQPHPVHEELKKYLNNFPGQRVVYDGELGADSLVTPL